MSQSEHLARLLNQANRSGVDAPELADALELYFCAPSDEEGEWRPTASTLYMPHMTINFIKSIL
jgi:hypothetical protein